jgi:hypothetical protein
LSHEFDFRLLKLLASLPVFSGLAAINDALQIYPIRALKHIVLSVFLR